MMTKLESTFSRIFNTECITTCNGTSAILAVLHHVRNYDTRRKVVIPAFGYPAALQVTLALGLEPIIVDINENLCLDVDKTIALPSNADIAAVVYINHGGIEVPGDLNRLRQWCDSRQILLIEDSATCLGLTNEYGRPFGTQGHYGIVSFTGKSKVLNAGSGGLLVVNSEQGNHLWSFVNMGGFNKNRNGLVGGALNLEMGFLTEQWIKKYLPYLGERVEFRQRLFKTLLDSIDPKHYWTKSGSLLMLKVPKAYLLKPIWKSAYLAFRHQYYTDVCRIARTTTPRKALEAERDYVDFPIDWNERKVSDSYIFKLRSAIHMIEEAN